MKIFFHPMVGFFDQTDSSNWERNLAYLTARSKKICQKEEFLDCNDVDRCKTHQSFGRFDACICSQVPAVFSFVDLWQGGPADSRDKESQSTIPISEKDADTRVELTVQGNSI